MSNETASKIDINIMVVIDTDYVKANYPNPSQEPDHPTDINHDSQFLICTDPRGIMGGQGTADLDFQATPGDRVSFRGVSIYGNSDDAVIVYCVQHWSGDEIFHQFVPNLKIRKHAVVPNVTSPDGLPAKTTKVVFTSLDSTVVQSGQANFHVYFALFTLADDGETQKLYGYYHWDPAITIQQSPESGSPVE